MTAGQPAAAPGLLAPGPEAGLQAPGLEVPLQAPGREARLQAPVPEVPPRAPGPEAPGTLVVIDMQHVFADQDSQWRAPRFAEAVGPVLELVAAYAPRVVFTRFVAPAVPQGAWRRYYELWPFALQPPESAIWDLVPEFAGHLAAQPGPVIDATTFGKWGPDLAARLDGGPMILAGVSTDCCVLSTALAAADDGMQVRVVAEACAGIDDASHAKALDIMALYAPLVEVISLEQALAGAREPTAA